MFVPVVFLRYVVERYNVHIIAGIIEVTTSYNNLQQFTLFVDCTYALHIIIIIYEYISFWFYYALVL